MHTSINKAIHALSLHGFAAFHMQNSGQYSINKESSAKFVVEESMSDHRLHVQILVNYSMRLFIYVDG